MALFYLNNLFSRFLSKYSHTLRSWRLSASVCESGEGDTVRSLREPRFSSLSLLACLGHYWFKMAVYHILSTLAKGKSSYPLSYSLIHHQLYSYPAKSQNTLWIHLMQLKHLEFLNLLIRYSFRQSSGLQIGPSNSSSFLHMCQLKTQGPSG